MKAAKNSDKKKTEGEIWGAICCCRCYFLDTKYKFVSIHVFSLLLTNLYTATLLFTIPLYDHWKNDEIDKCWSCWIFLEGDIGDIILLCKLISSVPQKIAIAVNVHCSVRHLTKCDENTDKNFYLRMEIDLFCFFKRLLLKDNIWTIIRRKRPEIGTNFWWHVNLILEFTTRSISFNCV